MLKFNTLYTVIFCVLVFNRINAAGTYNQDDMKNMVSQNYEETHENNAVVTKSRRERLLKDVHKPPADESSKLTPKVKNTSDIDKLPSKDDKANTRSKRHVIDDSERYIRKNTNYLKDYIDYDYGYDYMGDIVDDYNVPGRSIKNKYIYGQPYRNDKEFIYANMNGFNRRNYPKQESIQKFRFFDNRCFESNVDSFGFPCTDNFVGQRRLVNQRNAENFNDDPFKRRDEEILDVNNYQPIFYGRINSYDPFEPNENTNNILFDKLKSGDNYIDTDLEKKDARQTSTVQEENCKSNSKSGTSNRNKEIPDGKSYVERDVSNAKKNVDTAVALNDQETVKLIKIDNRTMESFINMLKSIAMEDAANSTARFKIGTDKNDSDQHIFAVIKIPAKKQSQSKVSNPLRTARTSMNLKSAGNTQNNVDDKHHTREKMEHKNYTKSSFMQK